MSKTAQRKTTFAQIGYSDAVRGLRPRYSKHPNLADYRRGYRKGKRFLETPPILGYENLDSPQLQQLPPISLEEARRNLENANLAIDTSELPEDMPVQKIFTLPPAPDTTTGMDGDWSWPDTATTLA